MNFARWSKMSPRDRMLAGLGGAFMPTHGVQVSTARGVQLGIAPLAGLGLMNTSTIRQDASTPTKTVTVAAGGNSYTVQLPSSGNLVRNTRPALLNPSTVQQVQPPMRIGPPATDSGGSTDPHNDPDYGYDTGGTAAGTPGTADDQANAAAADAADQVNAQNPVANVEDIRKANVKSLVSASSAGASVFDTVPKWVWPVGLAVVAWFVFKK